MNYDKERDACLQIARTSSYMEELKKLEMLVKLQVPILFFNKAWPLG